MMSENEWNKKDILEHRVIDILARALSNDNLDSETAKELSSTHAEWIRMQWGEGQYSAEAHRSLANMYIEDSRFSDYYDSRAGDGATELLVRAIIENV